ncbi:MAG TPA: response regulator [Planctomycetota bacterium]
MSLATRTDTDILQPTGRHVVVALDDDAETLAALKRLLRDERYELRTTFKPAEALEWIAAGEVSLLLSDHLMPEMTGVELSEAVQRFDTTCVLLTGYAERVHVSPGLEASVRELIHKPWDDRDLRKTIRLLLREREMREGNR